MAWLPSELPNLYQWSRQGRGITEVSGKASRWDDATGHGHHWDQTVDAKRPLIMPDGSLLFDGLDDYMFFLDAALVQPVTYCVMCRVVTWVQGTRILGGAAYNEIYMNGATPQLSLFAGLGFGTNGDLPVNTYGVITAIFNGASSSLQINRLPPITGNVGASNAQGLYLATQVGFADCGNVQFKETIVCSGVLTDTQIDQVVGYLLPSTGVEADARFGYTKSANAAFGPSTKTTRFGINIPKLVEFYEDAMAAELVKGDKGSKITVTCLNNQTGAVINISGKTVELRFKIGGGTLLTKTMTVTDGPNGVAEYQFTDTDLNDSGELSYEVRISPAAADQATSVELGRITVRAPLA